jgi:hypothetical protein
MVTEINQKLSVRSKELEESNTALRVLTTYIHDGFEGTRRMVSRLNLPAQVLNLYGLPLDGTNPNPTTSAEWLTIGQTFIKGARDAVQKGYPAIACPSADEIETVLNSAIKEHAEAVAADRNYDMTQAELAVQRGQANELINDVVAELRLTLRKLDPAAQRRIMRSYGARFQYLSDEPVDDGDIAPVVNAAVAA